jgi:hypothetical protein
MEDRYKEIGIKETELTCTNKWALTVAVLCSSNLDNF